MGHQQPAVGRGVRVDGLQVYCLDNDGCWFYQGTWDRSILEPRVVDEETIDQKAFDTVLFPTYPEILVCDGSMEVARLRRPRQEK